MIDFKKGDKVKWNNTPAVSGNGSLTLGLTLTVNTVNNGTLAYKNKGGYITVVNEQGHSAGFVYGCELKLVAETKEELTNIVNEAKLTISEAEAKLKFMEDTDSDVYDENTFKAFNVLKLVDNKKLSNIEKAKLIAELIK